MSPATVACSDGPTRGGHVQRTLARRLLFRRQFYLLLPGIIAHRLRAGDRRGHLFISLMGGIGDLVYFFPTLERLAAGHRIEMATAGYPYAAVVRNTPFVSRVYTPFIYKPHRAAHRRLIRRVLEPFYERVLLLDFYDKDWWKEGKHFSKIYSDWCGCPPPARGRIYLTDQNRRDADEYLARRGLGDFVYVGQVIRHRLPFRSWPLAHYHELYRLLRERTSLPILVDTVGSDEREIPGYCTDPGRLDILTAAAVMERARLFIGTDSGLTHVAAALGVPTVAIHIGYAPEICAPLGDNVTLIRQVRPFADPAATSPREVCRVVEAML